MGSKEMSNANQLADHLIKLSSTYTTAYSDSAFIATVAEMLRTQAVKIEALEKNAKRYQWLRDEPVKGEAVGIALMFLEPSSDGVGSLMPAECDKRIDAAIKGEQAA